MKATISNLLGTCRELITFDGADTEYPHTITDLKKCDNVLVGGRVDGPRSPFEVIIDNDLYLVTPCAVQHPCGGTLLVLEIC